MQKQERVEGMGGQGRAAPASIVGAVERSQKRDYRPAPYPYEVRRRAVQLHLEEGLTTQLVARELGLHDTTIYDWVKRYRQYGEAGLKGAAHGPGSSKLPVAVKEKIVELKREDPRQGARGSCDPFNTVATYQPHSTITR